MVQEIFFQVLRILPLPTNQRNELVETHHTFPVGNQEKQMHLLDISNVQSTTMLQEPWLKSSSSSKQYPMYLLNWL